MLPYILLGVVVLLLALRWFFSKPKESVNKGPENEIFEEMRSKHGIGPHDFPVYRADEVRKHMKADDLWLVINNKVYDVTGYVEDHEGGTAILRRVNVIHQLLLTHL